MLWHRGLAPSLPRRGHLFQGTCWETMKELGLTTPMSSKAGDFEQNSSWAICAQARKARGGGRGASLCGGHFGSPSEPCTAMLLKLPWVPPPGGSGFDPGMDTDTI